MVSGQKINQIADSVHGTILISLIEKNIISTQAFNRLHNVLQNSTAFLTFPSNKTKRFEHSLGVMHLGSMMFYHSITNADDETRDAFFSSINGIVDNIINTDEQFVTLLRVSLGDKYVELIYSFKDILIEDPLYKGLTPSVIKAEHGFAYVLLLQAIRLAALLHDVGHPPYSHIAESAIKEIWLETKGIQEIDRNSRQKLFLEATKFYAEDDDDAQLHEQIGYKISYKLINSLIEETKPDSKSKAQLQIFYWLVHYFVTNIFSEKTTIMGDIHRIIDSSIDCDRLDYITRDMNNSGFSFGSIEYDRLISSMALVKHEENFIFCPSITTLSTVEDFFHRRWQLYKYLVFHHRVVKTDKLLQKVIIKLAKDYIADNISDPTKPDNQALPMDISGLWLAVKEVVSNGRYFNALIQWDDAWLLTVLRSKFFEVYQKQDDNSIAKFQLEELLANKKYYRSMIKRMDAFVGVDKKVAEHFRINIDNLLTILDESWKPMLESLQNQIQNYEKEFLLNGFFLVNLKTFFLTLGYEKEFYDTIENVICEITCIKYRAKDCLVVFNKKLKTGLEKNPPLLNQQGKLVKLDEVSRIKTELTLNHRTFPLFFIYVMEDLAIIHSDYLNDLGILISNALTALIDDSLKILNKGV